MEPKITSLLYKVSDTTYIKVWSDDFDTVQGLLLKGMGEEKLDNIAFVTVYGDSLPEY